MIIRSVSGFMDMVPPKARWWSEQPKGIVRSCKGAAQLERHGVGHGVSDPGSGHGREVGSMLLGRTHRRDDGP